MTHVFYSNALPRKLAFGFLLLIAGCGGGSASDPLPNTQPLPNPGPQPILLATDPTPITEGSIHGDLYFSGGGSGNGQTIDGVGCSTGMGYHTHALISLYYNGKRLALPPLIGLDGCTYELHTHDASGVVHVETTTQKTFTVGQFFQVWGQPLSANGVAGLNGTPHFYVIENEQISPFAGDPTGIQFASHREIAIVIGTPPVTLDRNSWAGSGL